MSEFNICAAERTEKPNKVRKSGFVPAVIHGKGIDSKNIKFEQKELKRLLRTHAKNSRIGIKLGDAVKQCILKEIQKDPISGEILHVDLQAVQSDEIIRLEVPIVFRGKEKLTERQKLLQEYISVVEVMGKAADMPEFVIVDVEGKVPGDKITVKDIQISEKLKILDDESKILAVVTEAKTIGAE